MKRTILLLCALLLAYGTSFAAPAGKVATTMNDIPPAWSKTLQCDTTSCPRFEVVMNGTAVLDHETGLVWEQSPTVDLFTWDDAEYLCLNMVKINPAGAIGNRWGWRLPTIQELSSVLPLHAGHPFDNIQSAGYWSATTKDRSPDQAWMANLGGSNASVWSKAHYFNVWCVRGEHGVNPQ
jgi:hypothetical protein